MLRTSVTRHQTAVWGTCTQLVGATDLNLRDSIRSHGELRGCRGWRPGGLRQPEDFDGVYRTGIRRADLRPESRTSEYLVADTWSLKLETPTGTGRSGARAGQSAARARSTAAAASAAIPVGSGHRM